MQIGNRFACRCIMIIETLMRFTHTTMTVKREAKRKEIQLNAKCDAYMCVFAGNNATHDLTVECHFGARDSRGLIEIAFQKKLHNASSKGDIGYIAFARNSCSAFSYVPAYIWNSTKFISYSLDCAIRAERNAGCIETEDATNELSGLIVRFMNIM